MTPSHPIATLASLPFEHRQPARLVRMML